MCPPTTAASWIVQTRPGGSQSPVGVWKAVPNRFAAALERVGDGDEDPLAVDQQVGQVVGDQVADRDRQQPGADRAETDRPRDREREQHDDAHEREQQDRSLEDRPARRTRSKKLSVCDRPSKMIEETPNATRVTSAADQPGSSRPLPNERGWTRPSSSTSRQWARRPSRRNQTVNVSPWERHSSRPNWAIIASVSAV